MQKKSKGQRFKWIAWVLCLSVLLAICIPVLILISDSGDEIVRPDRVEADTSFLW